MKIDPAVLDAIKAMDLPSLIKSYGIELKPTGKNAYHIRCPFHEDKTPSLSVGYRNNKWMWNCFGCHMHGNYLDFRIAYEKIPFSDAYLKSAEEMRLLSSKVNGNGIPSSPAQVLIPPSTLNRTALLSRAVEVYHAAFLEDRRGLEYLAGRGIKGVDLLSRHRVGYVNGKLRGMLPEDTAHETVRGLREVGLLNENGREHFHGCVVFPIFDGNGGVVGMYGRRTAPLSLRPEHLYLPGPRWGVWNGGVVKAYREIVLTESIVDALSLEAMGVPNVTALYGVNGLTESHLVLFKEHRTKRVYLCLDNDRAGDAARNRIRDQIVLLGVEVVDVYLPREWKDANVALKRGMTAGEFTTLLEKAGSTGVKSATGVDEWPRVEKKEDGVHVEFTDRRYRVRGLKGKNLESLRVNVKVECEGGKHMDTLDLYSSKSREVFVSCCRKIFKVEAGGMEGELNRLVEELERLQVAGEGESVPTERRMSDEEAGEAMLALKSATLLEDVVRDMEALGYVGEEANKVIGYLVAVSRKLEDPLSCVIISQSSAGKSVLAETLEKMTPPEECLLYSRLTPQALCYMEKDALKRKLLIVEERVGAEAADYSIRTLQSKKRLVQAVPVKDPATGKIKTETFEVEGPVAYVETTTRPRINDENATRCFELYLDESQEQTERVHAAQRVSKSLAGIQRKLEGDRVMNRHRNMQRLLEPVKVVTPYTALLGFPTTWLRTRRDHLRFLNLIEGIAFLHQHQREKKWVENAGEGVPYIEATVEDYRKAYQLARQVLGESFTELKKPQRELLTSVEGLIERSREGEVSRREIREYTGLADTRLRDLLGELVSLEYLVVVEGKQGKSYRYRLSERGRGVERILVGLTTPEELEQRLSVGGVKKFAELRGRGCEEVLKEACVEHQRVSV